MVTPAPPAAAGGLPQFDLAQWPGQIVWALLVFAGLYVLLAKVFLPRVGGTIEARAKKIADEIGAARRMRDEAAAEADAAREEMAQARQRARKLAADAAADANLAAQTRRSEEDARLGEILTAADARIAQARAAAMGQLSGVASETASAIIHKLTGETARAGEIEAALRAAAT